MKTILSFFYTLFAGLFLRLYEMAEAKFTLQVVAVAPTLGVAHRFAALGKSGVTGSTGAGTVVTGDVGSSPTPTISNFPPSSVAPPFTLHLFNDATVIQAQVDATLAYGFLAAQGPGTVLAAQLDGAVLTSGLYSFLGGAADLAALGTLTLNGPGIFVFQVDSALTMNVGSNVVGTADPCNIYWRIGTSGTLNGITTRGIFIADASLTLGSGSNLDGILLAGTGPTGAVTMAGACGNTIGGCSELPLVPTVPAVSFNLFFDNSQYAPGPVGTTIPFNDEPNDIWMSYDPRTDVSPLGFLNIWNYNRTLVILSIPVGPPAAGLPTPIQFFDETQSTPVQQTANNDFNRENNIWLATQSDGGGPAIQYLHILNFNRTGIIGSIPLAPDAVLAKDLQYMDNTNNEPTPPNVNSSFNNEPIDLWIGWHRLTNRICVTNYNRTVVIGCVGAIAP